jgi:hypothetical protein
MILGAYSSIPLSQEKNGKGPRVHICGESSMCQAQCWGVFTYNHSKHYSPK